MTSSKENIFRVTGPLWGEFSGHRCCQRRRKAYGSYSNVRHLCYCSRSVTVWRDVICRPGRGIIVQVKKAVSVGAARPSGCTNSYQQKWVNKHFRINDDIDFVWLSQLHFLLVKLHVTIITHSSYCTSEIQISVFNQVNSLVPWEFQLKFR